MKRLLLGAALFLIPAGCGYGVGDGPGTGSTSQSENSGGAGGGSGTPTNACTQQSLGGPNDCKGEADWKAAAAAACGASAHVDGSVTFSNACGTGAYREAAFKCCPNPAGGGSGGGGGATTCTSHSANSATCKGENDWKAQAAAECGSATVHELHFGGACSTGGYTEVSYSCCL